MIRYISLSLIYIAVFAWGVVRYTQIKITKFDFGFQPIFMKFEGFIETDSLTT